MKTKFSAMWRSVMMNELQHALEEGLSDPASDNSDDGLSYLRESGIAAKSVITIGRMLGEKKAMQLYNQCISEIAQAFVADLEVAE